MSIVSNELVWACIQKTHCFRMKVLNQKHAMSRDPMNVTGINSMKYNGLVNNKSVGVIPCKDGKGFELLTKNQKSLNKPAKMVSKRTFKKGARTALYKLEKTIGKYRSDLLLPTLIKASCILQSQKPVKKTRGKGAKKE